MGGGGDGWILIVHTAFEQQFLLSSVIHKNKFNPRGGLPTVIAP